MWSKLRRMTAAAVSFSLILTCAGLEPYAAFGATFTKAPETTRVPGVVLPQLPSSPLVALPPATLQSSVLPSAMIPALPVAAAATPSAAAAPAAASLAPRAASAQAAAPSSAAPAVSNTAAQPAVEMQKAAADARFDGVSVRSEEPAAPVATPASAAAPRPSLAKPSFISRARKALSVAALATVLAFSGAAAHAQTAGPAGAPQGPPPAAQTAPAPAQPADSVQAPVVLSKDLAVSARFGAQGMKVGERVQLFLTIKNQTAKPVTIVGLRGSVEDALPEALELQQPQAQNGQEPPQDGPITLAPGESREVAFDAIPFDSGDLTVEGPVAITVQNAQGEAQDLNFALPKTTLKVASILTPDWKDKGFRDAAGVMKRTVPEWVWLAALPLLGVLLIGIERILAAQKEFPRVAARKIPLIVRSRERLAALAKRLDEPERVFYAEFDSILTNFLVDFHGLTTAERTPAALAQELKKIRTLSPGQVRVAGDLLRRAEDARFSGEKASADARRRDLANLSDLIDSIAGKADAKNPPKPGASTLPAAAALEFGHPWALLLFIPLIARAVWSYFNRHRKGGFTVSDAGSLPGKRSLRQRLAWLPKALRTFAVASLLIALAHPQLGVRRDVVWRPSTDTMIEFDVSGSMDEQVGQNLSKLQAAGEAAKGYIDEQRRGTDNRVGLGTFSDNAYLDVRLTTDYDALIAHLKELHTLGSTAIGKAMLDATAHFIELNITELSDPNDPRMAEAQKILREKGLPAVLEYAQQYPDLMQKILRPDRAKVVVLFTDGDSNTGIDPVDAARIAKSLGVKVYTVFIGPDGASGVAPLQQVAQITGAKYYRAADPDAMRNALLEVDKLEKSPSRVVSSLSLQDYSRWFVLMALLALGFEVALANTRLRALQGLLILSLPLGTLPGLPQNVVNPPAIVAQVGAPKSLPVQGVPKDVAAANLLYNEGRYDEALKAYGEALKLHPDMPELYFNMGDAYLKLGELDKAAAAYQGFIGKTQDKAQSSRAVYNLSVISLAKKDAEQAKALLKESLRRDPGNEDARWNLEVLNKLQQQQQQQQQNQPQNKKNQKGKKGQKGQKGNQPGQPGQGQPQPGQGQPQQGQPGQQNGQGQPKDGKGDKPGSQQLAEKLGEQQKEQGDAARKAIPRKGHDAWGALALPLAAAGGTALTFSSPIWAWAAVVVAPVVAGILAYGLHKRLQAAKQLSPGTAPKDFKSWWGRGRFLRKAALVTTAAALLTFGVADPKSGYTDERVNFGGKDVIVAVDGSPSTIYAEDGRFANTKKELSDFAERLQGTDRVGLIVFAGEARTASPLSVDYGNLQFKAERLERESMGLKDGSKLAEAVEFAAKSFETAKDIGDRDRILVVVSDGEIFGEDLDKAIEAARQHHVTIYTIGVGSERGVKMKVPTEDGTGTEYIQDDQTHGDALTRLDEAPLRKLASATGGAYFRGGDGATLSKVMARVAESNKGRHSETIRSPRGAAELFLWPALALLILDMALPGFSVLRRQKKVKKDDGGKTKLHGGAFALLGLAALPLSSWPIVLPFAVVSTVLGGLLAADLWTDGALTRRFVWALQRRRGFVQKGVAADLPRLLTAREIDQERLSQFIKAWQAAPDAARGALVEEASQDPELAREKLVSAYLSGGEPALLERAITELGRTSRRQLKPVAPIVRQLLAERARLDWARHGDAARALGRLSQAFLDPAEAAQARKDLGLDAPKAGWTPAARGLKRVTLGLALVVAVGSLTLSGASGWGTMRYFEERAKAQEAATRLFYSEDVFVFSDRYVDDRIPQYVLPALRRWSENTPGAYEDMQRAIEVLAKSPDPKADNLLEAILRRSELLPLTDSAEQQLLTSLVLRDNDHVWRFMDELMVTSAGKPQMTQRLEKMLLIALSTDNPRAFENAFHFLKSPDENLQGFAARAVFARLLAYNKAGQFYDRLGAVQGRYAADPELNLWVERFLLMQASGGKDAGYDAKQARPILEKILDAGKAYDASRAPLLARMAAAAAQAKANGQQAQQQDPVPSLVSAVIHTLGEAAAAQGAPDAVKELAKSAVDRTTTELIKEAEAAIPGLHEKLIADGVVLKDSESSYGGYDEYEGRGYGGYSSTQKNYRERYKLQHLRTLQQDIAEMAGKIQSNAKDQPAFLEMMDRAGQALPVMLEAGQAAGMLDGNSVAEKAADDVNVVLADGVSKFSGSGFIQGLRAKGLAPDNGATSGEELYRESYTLDEIKGVRAYVYSLAIAGNGFEYDGKPRPLTVAERKYLAGALEQLNALEAKHYQAVPEKDAPPDALALSRLSVLADQAAGDGAKERALMGEALKLLAGPYGAKATPEEVTDVLDSILKGATKGADRRAILEALTAALEKAPAKSGLALAGQARVKTEFSALEAALNDAFPGFNAKAAQAGARSGEYSDYTVLKLSHLRALDGVVNAAELEAKTKGALDDKQKEAIARARATLPTLTDLGLKAGMLPGDTPGEKVAQAVNPKLYADYQKFYGQVIKKELIKRGLAPDNSQTDVEGGYAQTYSKADLQKVLAFLEEIKASGNGWSDDTARRPLTADEKTVLDDSINTVREQLQNYPQGKTTLHGAAWLGLAPLAAAFGGWQLALIAAVALVAGWLYTRWSKDDGAGSEQAPAKAKTGASPEAARRAKRVELAAKKLASSVAGGSFRSLFVGAGGTDFAESRPYAGEDRRDIDWKATAKQGEPYAKKYELEKEMPLVLVVDVSGSGAFGTRGEEKREVIEDVASVLALAAAQLNLRVGAVFVSDKVEAYIPPKGGAQQAHEIIARLQAQTDEPRRTDLKPALELALKEIRSRAVVAVVSDFLAPDFRASISALAQRHDVRPIRVSDPAELRPLPDVGLLPVRDGETGELRDVDTSNAEFRAEHAALIERREGRLADAFSQARLRPLTLSTEGDYLQELQDAFDPKAQLTRSTP